MIDPATGAFQFAGVWCHKGESRVDIQKKLKSFTWVKALSPQNNLPKQDFTQIEDDYYLQIKFEDIFGMLSFRGNGLVLVKFGLMSVYEKLAFKQQVKAYKAFLLEKCGLNPGKYEWGQLRVNEDFRDGSSEIDVIYD